MVEQDCSFLSGMTLLVAGCSQSLADNFAIDWIIESLGLRRQTVLTSACVEPMIQPGAFADSHFTTSMELFASQTSSVSVLQIRSNVSARSVLAGEIMDMAKEWAVRELIVVGAADACFLSGEALEKAARFRIAGSRKIEDIPSIPLQEVHAGGLIKALVGMSSDELPVWSILVLVSGSGFTETRILSERLAEKVLLLTDSSKWNEKLRVPLSIKQLESNPSISVEVSRVI